MPKNEVGKSARLSYNIFMDAKLDEKLKKQKNINKEVIAINLWLNQSVEWEVVGIGEHKILG